MKLFGGFGYFEGKKKRFFLVKFSLLKTQKFEFKSWKLKTQFKCFEFWVMDFNGTLVNTQPW